MKMAMTALAVVLMAAAGTASAQPGEQGDGWRSRDGERSERGDRPQRDRWQGEGRRDGGPRERPMRDDRREASRPPEAAVAAPAPTAPQAGVPRDGGWRGERPRDGSAWSGRRGDEISGDREPERRQGDGRRVEGDRDDGARRDWDRRGEGRRDGDRRWEGRRDNDRWSDRRYDRYPRWQRDRYAPSYNSGYRYRHAWRRPYGYYDRSWLFGDILPRGWYGSGYWLVDPWRFNLPLPPPGFDWVRVGDDALLVDQYNGRIVQVVRHVFW